MALSVDWLAGLADSGVVLGDWELVMLWGFKRPVDDEEVWTGYTE